MCFLWAVYLAPSESLSLTAYFSPDNGGENGIDDADADGISITTADGIITVNGADGESVCVYDITGRMVASSHTGETIALPASGVYVVKVGTTSSRKVVVLKLTSLPSTAEAFPIKERLLLFSCYFSAKIEAR